MNSRYRGILLALVVLVVVGPVAGERRSAVAPGLSTQERAWLAAASRTERAGWVVLRLKGVPEAVGFQRGYLTAREIDAMRADFRHFIPRDTGKDWTFFVAEAGKQFKGKIPEEYERELRGMAAGAGKAGVDVSYEELLFLNGFIDLLWYWWEGAKDKVAGAGPGCSAFIATGAATGGRGIVMGHNTWIGFMMGKHLFVVVDMVPEKGHRMVMQTIGPSIYSATDFFVTDAGLVGTETTIGGFKGYRKEGVPMFVRARHAMQYADCIDGWVRLVAENNNGAYANSWLIGDVKNGEIARFELGLKSQKLDRKRDGCFSGSNVAEDPAILRLETGASYDDIRDFAVARRTRWEQLLNCHTGRIDTAFGRKFLADHKDMYLRRNRPSWRTLCGHGWEDDGRIPGSCQPYWPIGSLDAKVIDSAMARKLSFFGRAGLPCGTAFNAEKFLAAHPQYRWMQPVLRDFPSRPWVELPGAN